MDKVTLVKALREVKAVIEKAITTATYNGKTFPNGAQAKNAAIRSQKIILNLHEVVKGCLVDELNKQGLRYISVHPPLGQSSPEMKMAGFIKAKDQDITVLFSKPRAEIIPDGALAGMQDEVGKNTSHKSIVIGVRSQMSSIDKNFDTLMERAFAETLNMRLRLPGLVMGEVYMLPIFEYDDSAMVENRVGFKKRPINAAKFINTFLAISNRLTATKSQDLHKYNRTALVFADFRKTPPVLFETLADLKNAGVVTNTYAASFDVLSPVNFCEPLVNAYKSVWIARKGTP
jgi:hypothetical protein